MSLESIFIFELKNKLKRIFFNRSKGNSLYQHHSTMLYIEKEEIKKNTLTELI